MERHAVTMTRQRDIGTVTIHARRRQHMRPVHRHALRLVDRGGIAMIEIAIVFDVKRDIAPVIGTHRHALLADPLDRPERAIFHLQTALVRSEEHTSELQSLMRISYAVFCLTKKK